MMTRHVPERRVLLRARRRAFPARHVLFDDDDIDVEIMELGYEADDREGAAPPK